MELSLPKKLGLAVFMFLLPIVLIFVVFPFAFIRFFYAPWLGARRVPGRLAGHVMAGAALVFVGVYFALRRRRSV